MEPFKALTLLATAGVVSLVGAGAAGFYAGYSAARGSVDEIKTQIANAPVAVGAGGGAVSLKPVLEDIRALSKQVEALAAVKGRSAGDAEHGSKSLVDEIKGLSVKIDGLRQGQSRAADSTVAAASAPDHHNETLSELREQIRAINTKLEKSDNKAPKALLDEIRLLSASVQAQEPNVRRTIGEEVRGAVATLQNSEPKVPKALMEEVRNIAANVRSQDGRPQASVIDQIKLLAASVESLKARLPDESGRSRGDGSVGSEVAQLRQLVASASDEFGKCQAQLVSLTGSSTGQGQPPAASALNTVSVSPTAHREPSTVVFFDNVMLKKDQEKQYEEIGVRLALQSVGARQVRVAVNKQGFGLAFGERKVFRSQDVECELNLMETNLNDSQARVSISCKR
jgi:hypothetical protein